MSERTAWASIFGRMESPVPPEPLDLTAEMMIPGPPSHPVTPRPPVPQAAPAYREVKVIAARKAGGGWGLIEHGELQAVAVDPEGAGRALAELLRQG